MLVQFMVRNFLSFKDETVFDMTAINAYKEHESNLIDIGTKEKFVKVAAIYGANASGKSNLNIAMKTFQRIISQSFNTVETSESTVLSRYYMPFSFENNTENTEFQIVVIKDGYEYCYGYEYNSECIVAEWLYRKDLKTNRSSTIFERTTDNVNLGQTVLKCCAQYKEQVPKETLTLSFFHKLKLETDIFRIVYSNIMKTLVVGTDYCDDEQFLRILLSNIVENNKQPLLAFLNAIDSGIKDIECVKKDKETEFFAIHRGKDEKNYKLDLFLESEGTIKSIMLFIHVLFAIVDNKSIFIDELNAKLHPLLLKFIIDLFYENDSEAQLIYTTHDTTLLSRKFFRRDQIWFVEKDEYGYSKLSALSDYKVRSDASFEKDYLAGVYGGIPIIKEFNLKEVK